MVDSPTRSDAFESGVPTNPEPAASAEAAVPTEATDVVTDYETRMETDAAAASGTGNKRGWSMKVATKIMAVVGLCLAMLVTVAGISIWQINDIGREFEGITERDIALTEIITKITIHQLEQAINLERAIRFGEEMQTSAAARMPFEQAVTKFEELAAKVDKEITAGEKLVAKNTSPATKDEERTDFQDVLAMLKKIDESPG